MRKIVYKNMEKHLDLDKNIFYNIVVENQNEYFHLVNELIILINNNEEGNITLSNDSKICSLKKHCSIITNLFDLNLIDRKTINLLYKHIDSVTEKAKYFAELETLSCQICNILEIIRLDIDIDIDYDDEYDLISILKLANVIPVVSEGRFLLKLIDYIKLVMILTNQDIFFILNLKDLLNKEDLIAFIKEMNLLNINIINIETKIKSYKTENEYDIIIDEDLCEYYNPI